MAAQAPEGGSPFGGQFWLFLAAMVAIMYFIVIRPNQKRERERRQMLDNLQKGDTVVTAGGIVGKVVGTDQNKVVIRVSEEPVLKLEFLRTSIARVVNPEDEKKED